MLSLLTPRPCSPPYPLPPMQLNGHHVDQFTGIPTASYSVNMVPDEPGNWLFHCETAVGHRARELAEQRSEQRR